jgi:hypothetical protein
MGLRPVPASLFELCGGLVVAGHQHGRLIDGTQDVDAHPDMTADIPEIAGTDEYIRCTRTLRQKAGGCRTGMQVTKQQQLYNLAP